MMTLDKEVIGWISVGFTLMSLLPYYYFTLKNVIKPHLFTWLIWSLLTAIGFWAGQSSGAGPGSWAMGVVSVGCLGVAVLALFKGERNITRGDWACLIAALSAIPLWYVTSNPLWSVVLISIIDTIGFVPTMRKAYHEPYEELMFTYVTGMMKYLLALLAIDQWVITNWLYPAVICTSSSILILLLAVRRWQIKRAPNPA